LYGSLIVGHIRRHTHPGSPFLSGSLGIVRHRGAI
jgi:hypothetical protein